MKASMVRLVALFLATGLWTASGRADTLVNWQGPGGTGSGNWSTAADWSGGVVPNNGSTKYGVTLPTESGSYTVTQDINISVDSLTVDSGATLTGNSGITLTVTSLTNSGTMNYDSGNTLTVNGASTISSGAQLNIEGGSTASLNGTTTNSGSMDLQQGSKLTVAGSLTNSGQVYTNQFNFGGTANTLTVNGTFTNNAGATFAVGNSNNTTDVANVQSLVNNGNTTIGTGATLNLTSQPNGITDVVQGSTLQILGSLKAGSANGLAKLASVEGSLYLENGQATTATPGTGTLTVSSTGILDLQLGTTLTVAGNLSNSGQVYTNQFNFGGTANTLTVNGTFTNNAGATFAVGSSNNTTDVASVQTLVNNGSTTIGTGATLNLTNQPNGITDVAQGSTLVVEGSLKAGSANGLAKLGSVEGSLYLENGQATTATPGTGTLTVSSTGILDLQLGTTLTVAGSLTNSGQVYTNQFNFGGSANTLTVNGTFTNNAGATFAVGSSNNTTDVASVQTLVNNGNTTIGTGATLNLTNQPNGITDVAQGSTLVVEGSLKAGSANGLAKLASVEGSLYLENGQATTATPGTGTLTVSSTGLLDLQLGTTLTVAGNLTNSGQVYTNQFNFGGTANTLTVNGTFTNNAGATFAVGSSNNTTDVASVQTLVNNGSTTIGTGATLNLTNQPNGITDVAQGSTLVVEGSLKAGSANGLAKLGSVEGSLYLENGQATTATPGTGTLTVSSTGILDLQLGTTLTVAGNLTNSGQVYTNQFNFGGTANTLTVNGTFTNNAGATFAVGSSNNTTDVASVGTLSNSGTVDVDNGTTLSLTASGTGSNTGTINVGTTSGAATLKINAAAITLSGNGKVILSNNAANLITGVVSTDVLTSANTIEGSGTISKMGFVNTGTVLANQSTALIIDPSSSGFNNKGTLNVSTGDELQITGPANSFLNYSATNTTLTNGTYLVSGTLQFGATGNTITTDDAKITLTGAAAKIVDPSGGNILAPLSKIGTGSLFDITSGATFTTLGNFTNNGTLTVGGGGSKFVVKSGSNLTNFSGTTLTGGTYNVTGTLQFGASGTSLVTNAASITLTGAQAKIISSAGASILTNFATNNVGATFDIANGYNFTTAGNFTNNGSLIVGSTNSKFDVNGNLTNFNSGTDTLTGGIYNVTGTLQFNNANIVTNSANLTVNGASYKIDNQTAGNGLANFATNSSTGSFTLAKNANFSSLGTLTNSGTVTVNKGSTLTIGASGNYTQTAGNTTVDGTLVATGAGIIQVNGGNVFGNGGNLNGNTSNSGTLNIGDAVKKAGAETVTGTYTQNSAGALDIDIGGNTAGTQFDQLTVTGAASLNGTLNLDLINNFVPTVGSMFDILNASTLNGTTFATVTGTGINSNEHFSVVYNTNNVTLDVVAGMGLLAAANLPLNSPTPEPGSLLLLGTGFAALGTYWRRRRSSESSGPGK